MKFPQLQRTLSQQAAGMNRRHYSERHPVVLRYPVDYPATLIKGFVIRRCKHSFKLCDQRTQAVFIFFGKTAKRRRYLYPARR